MERIKAFGVELEGGYDKLRFEDIYGRGYWHGDSSVSTTKPKNGECVSPPLTDIEVMSRFIEKYYPDEVNKSCGFHIHISLHSNLDYARLATKRFHRYFLKQWDIWGKRATIKNEVFWDRLNEKSEEAQHYCKRSFQDPYSQMYETHRSDRYHQLNYCWQRHGTLENRMLPMFKEAHVGISALKFYLEFVEKWLKMQKREYGIADVVQVEEGEAEHEDYKTGEDDDNLGGTREIICV